MRVSQNPEAHMCGNVTAVSAKGLCCGCGVCAGVAPRACIAMESNEFGEYIPRVSDCTGCGLCLQVCPFASPLAALPEDWPLGSVQRSYVGWSSAPGERQRSSSGGLATRVLKALLAEELVDAVVGVVPIGDPDRLFEPAVLRTAEEVDRAVGSKYYPVEFSQVLRQLRSEEGRYAVIGLPCATEALRRAAQNLPWLRSRLRFTLALVCGHGVSKHHAAFLAFLSGLGQSPLQRVDFRSKSGTTRPGDYRFVAQTQCGATGRELPFGGRWVQHVWCNELFAPDACFMCTDLFGYHADASFMDAWLPRYGEEPRGTSIVAVRNADLVRLFEEEQAAGRVHLAPIPESEVLASQEGALARKRQSADAGLGSQKALNSVHDRIRRSRWAKQALQGRGGLRRAAAMRLLAAYVGQQRTRAALRRCYWQARGTLGKLKRRALTRKGSSA